MKKFFATVLILALLLSLTACGSDTATSGTDTNTPLPSQTTPNETAAPSVESEELVEYDIFKNVLIKYGGWIEYGVTIEINTDYCDSLIRDNVSFSLASDYRILRNGDIITVIAEYNESVFAENGYKVISATRDFPVDGLRSIFVLGCQDYSEGLAWIPYVKDGQRYLACIDKSGTMVFGFNTNFYKGGHGDNNGDNVITTPNVVASPFSNGYAHLQCTNEYWQQDAHFVIDTTGTVRSSYLSDNYTVIAYGDGYVLTEEHISGFDVDKYVYKIFDPNGTVICDTVSEKIAEFTGKDVGRIDADTIAYRGEGVFSFEVKIDGQQTKVHYCISSGEWVRWNCNDGMHFYQDDFAATGIRIYDGADILFYLNREGAVYETKLPSGRYWDTSDDVAMYEDFCILTDYKSYLISCDTITDEFYSLDEKYLEKLVWGFLPDPLIFDNGRIALLLRGSDNEEYVAIFDTHWNVIMEPIKASTHLDYLPVSCYSDGLVVLKVDGKEVVYDTEGQMVFSLSKLGYFCYSTYSDSALRVYHYSDEDKILSVKYVDKNGEFLFDSIDTGDMIESSLPNLNELAY